MGRDYIRDLDDISLQTTGLSDMFSSDYFLDDAINGLTPASIKFDEFYGVERGMGEQYHRNLLLEGIKSISSSVSSSNTKQLEKPVSGTLLEPAMTSNLRQLYDRLESDERIVLKKLSGTKLETLISKLTKSSNKSILITNESGKIIFGKLVLSQFSDLVIPEIKRNNSLNYGENVSSGSCKISFSYGCVSYDFVARIVTKSELSTKIYNLNLQNKVPFVSGTIKRGSNTILQGGNTFSNVSETLYLNMLFLPNMKK